MKCCKQPMHKAGKVWSGKNRVQRYRCNKCGRTTTRLEVKIPLSKELSDSLTNSEGAISNKVKNDIHLSALKSDHIIIKKEATK